MSPRGRRARTFCQAAPSTIFRGVLPFLAAETAILFLLTVFPQLVTVPARWLY